MTDAHVSVSRPLIGRSLSVSKNGTVIYVAAIRPKRVFLQRFHPAERSRLYAQFIARR